MPENNDESCSKMVHCVLDAPQRMIIHQVAGSADDEEVPDALIKNYFGRRPRISAPDDDGKGMLFLRGFGAAGGDGLARANFVLSKSLVAGFQATESLIGSDGWSRRISGHRPAAESDRHYESEITKI